MKGWKTWTGVAGIVITQVALTYLGVDEEAANQAAGQVMELIRTASGALALVGIGHKVEKGGK